MLFLTEMFSSTVAITAYDTANCNVGEQILAKAEMLNVGGSVKDRVALEIVREAMAEGCLKPGGLITEGTAGDPSTQTHKQCIQQSTCKHAGMIVDQCCQFQRLQMSSQSVSKLSACKTTDVHFLA